MLQSQGVGSSDARELCYGDPWKVMTKAKYKTDLKSEVEKGKVVGIDARKIGQVRKLMERISDYPTVLASLLLKGCNLLGAGRFSPDDKLDHSVGIRLKKVRGDNLEKGEAWQVSR